MPHPSPEKSKAMESEDKRINQLTQISNAPENGVLPIDVPGSTETNGITAGNLINQILSNGIPFRGVITGGSQESIDNNMTPGVYMHGSGVYGTGDPWHGIILVLKAQNYIIQVDFTAMGKIFYRWGKGKWISINITPV